MALTVQRATVNMYCSWGPRAVSICGASQGKLTDRATHMLLKVTPADYAKDSPEPETVIHGPSTPFPPCRDASAHPHPVSIALAYRPAATSPSAFHFSRDAILIQGRSSGDISCPRGRSLQSFDKTSQLRFHAGPLRLVLAQSLNEQPVVKMRAASQHDAERLLFRRCDYQLLS